MKTSIAIVFAALVGATGSASAVNISHSASLVPTTGSVSCNAGGVTAENSYYRTFNLASFGITDPFNISSVQIGVESALAGGGGSDQPLTMNIYNTTTLGALGSPIASANYSVSDQSLTLLSLPISASILTGEFTVEIFVADAIANGAGHRFFIGSNADGQTAPSFIRAPSCGITSPFDLAGIGFPNMHIVMNVVGEAVPSPSAAALLGLGGLMAARRRR